MAAQACAKRTAQGASLTFAKERASSNVRRGGGKPFSGKSSDEVKNLRNTGLHFGVWILDRVLVPDLNMH
jgi:hypothetical protein